jgi:transposase
VRCFKTFTDDLRAMAAWLARCGITTVAMESTGVYWIPPYEVLEEAGMRVCLVNSQHVRHVPGRKSDVSDCQWLQYLHSVGLLQSSFRPDAAICALRSLSRHRASLVESASVHIQHMHKALTQMNLQIHHVLSDITGVSGMAIIEAIVAGERDPLRLAALCHAKVHADRQTVIKSLVGHYRPEHLFTLKQSLAAFKNYQYLLAECDQEIQHLTGTMSGKIDSGSQPPLGSPNRQKRRKNQFHFDMRSELYRLFGVDLTKVPGISALTAHALLAEVGPDLSRFRSAAAFANWLALCPGNKKSGGKILSSKTRPTNSRAAHALRVAAQTLARSRSHLGNFYRSMRARLGAPQAITAAAHKLARILYHLLTTGKDYDETVFAQQQQKQKLRLHKRLSKQAHQLGFQLIPIPLEDTCSC